MSEAAEIAFYHGEVADTLMRMQNSYDIAKARKRAGDIKVAPFKAKIAMGE
jgi:plasmid maintenance system antidote protein VapI